ncbi:hypothetical protein GGI07_003365 [Coemansia sp. Benny D115]|nr:hypothetical protein GGI07_003365 [Coemansia sp. Benny D115]
MVVVCAESLYSDASDTLVDTPLQKDERIIMYICGGGFVSCDAPMERFVYEHISERLQMRLFVPRYGTAPQYCYPQPVHDVYTTLMYLISRGFRSQDIVLLGLSAGGNIAVALMNLLAMGQNESQVAGCILVSPFLDLAMEGRSWQTNRDNCVIVNRSLRDKQSMPRMYFGRLDGCLDGYDRFIKELRHPLMSPVFGDLERLPLVQVHVGSHEVMLDDSVTFCERMGNDRAELFVYEGKNHYSIIRGKQQLDQVYGHMRRFVQQLAQAAN